MSEDTLRKLGLTAEQDEHPADTVTLDRLGLKPEIDEHPAAAKTAPTVMDRVLGRGTERVQSWPERLVRGAGRAIGEAVTTPATVSQPNPYPEGSEENSWFEGQRQNAMVSGANTMAGFASGSPAIVGKTGLPAVAGASGVITEGGRALGNAVREIGPTSKAYDFIADKLGDEAPDVLARLRENPRLRLMDVSDPLRLTAQGMVDPATPAAVNHVVRSARTSTKEAEGSVRGLFDTAAGPAPNTVAEFQKLQNSIKDVGKTKIQPALDASGPVDTSRVLSDIDKALNPAPVKMTPGTQISPTPLQQRLTELRRDLASGDSEVLTDPNRLHDVQADLRREADDLMQTKAGARLGRQLMEYRNKLVDAIDAAGPANKSNSGSYKAGVDAAAPTTGYKDALAGYKDANDVQRAFEMGRGALKNGEAIETYPEYWKNWLSAEGRSPEELQAVKLGARDAIERKMAQFKFAARRGTDIPEVDFDRQKLELLFGKEQTNKLWKGLHDEKDIAYTNNRILNNSKTAETIAANNEVKPREVEPPHTGLPLWATTMGLAGAGLTHSPELGVATGAGLLGLRGAKAGAQWVGRQSDIARNSALSRIISSQGSERDQALKELTAAINRRSTGNKLSDLVVPP